MDYDSWHLWHRMLKQTYPDSYVHGATMGPTWGQDPVGPMLSPGTLLSG